MYLAISQQQGYQGFFVYGVYFFKTLVYLASERSERAQSCSCSIEISDTYVYIYIYMWRYVKLYAHARWYVMWEGLSVNHFHKHSNRFK